MWLIGKGSRTCVRLHLEDFKGGVLSTEERHRRHLYSSASCPSCQQAPEYMEHLFHDYTRGKVVNSATGGFNFLCVPFGTVGSR